MHAMKRAVLGLAATAALAAAGVAAADTMSPVFGARLSGMGEHGIVNFHARPAHHDLCWTFRLAAKGVTAASIRDSHGMVVAKLGAYRKSGCAMVAARALTLLEANPTKYSVWVDTKGHPGALRGKLVRGMVHA
jgi:hypothetical protein